MRSGPDEADRKRFAVKILLLDISVIVIEKREIIEYNRFQETWGARYSCNFEPTKL